MTAALVLARAPDDPAALPGLAPRLGPGRTAALQALLIRRAAAWAAAVAPGAAFIAVPPREAAGVATPADADLDAVAALIPGVAVFAAADLDAAIARVGRGPLLVAGTGCPRLGAAHAAAAIADLRAGCDIVFGATLEGGWYLAGLREPRPELLSVAVLREGGIGAVLGRARELGAEVGLLRHERVLATPGDAAALIADPLVDDTLRAALSA
jgi:glycosyltransferase A (GT-A) superfamily protein (DUF2064 family)